MRTCLNRFRKSKTAKAFLLILDISIICTLVYPWIYEWQCKSRTDDELSASLTDDIMMGNIKIVDKQEEGKNTSYGAGASGVVFQRDGDIYYALTAAHVINKTGNVEYRVASYGTQTYDEYCEEKGKYVPYATYYESLAKATVLCSSDEYDLAVISFYSEKELSLLPISDTTPQYKDSICTIGNPEGDKFAVTFGKIKSKKYYIFDSNDEMSSVKTLKINAYVAPGNSGGVVLNSDMEIVGIVIGGGTDMLGRFKCGYMVPSDLILEFLGERQGKVNQS